MNNNGFIFALIEHSEIHSACLQFKNYELVKAVCYGLLFIVSLDVLSHISSNCAVVSKDSCYYIIKQH